MSREFKKLSPLFFFIPVFFSINIVQAQILEKDVIKSGQQLENTENGAQFTPYKAIFSPNLSVWMPIGGDDSEVYGMSLKFGAKLIFKTSDRLLIELGYSYSSLRVKEDYIKGDVKYIWGDEVTDLKESSGGNVNQFFGGIRVLLPSKGKNLPYLRIGASNYKRGDITASYSGRGSYYTYEGKLRIHNEESGVSICGGFGMMILIGNKVAFDIQANANLLLLEENKPIWFEPAIALNILL